MEYSQGKWSSAAKNGLILASITIGVSLISSLLHSSSFIVGALLWIVKTGGSIWLLHKIMKEYSALKESISYGESFKYGFAVTLFSSLVISAYLFLSLTVIFPSEMEKVTEAMLYHRRGERNGEAYGQTSSIFCYSEYHLPEHLGSNSQRSDSLFYKENQPF